MRRLRLIIVIICVFTFIVGCDSGSKPHSTETPSITPILTPTQVLTPTPTLNPLPTPALTTPTLTPTSTSTLITKLTPTPVPALTSSTTAMPTSTPTLKPTLKPTPTQAIVVKEKDYNNYEKQADMKKLTDDGIEIHYIGGKGYIDTIDLQYKFNCSVVGSSYEKKLRIFGEKFLPAWDLEVMEPLIITSTFLEYDNGWYFDIDYYENTIKSILNKPRSNQPSYTENNVKVYLDNGIEYVLPSDIASEYFGKEFRFNYNAGNKFSVLQFERFQDNYDYNNGKEIISDIPSKAINGHLCIEYKYVKENILPVVKNK